MLSSLGAMAYYLVRGQKLSTFVHIRPFQFLRDDKKLKVTSSTLLGLDILPKSSRKDSLLGFLDRTRTPMGGAPS